MMLCDWCIPLRRASQRVGFLLAALVTGLTGVLGQRNTDTTGFAKHTVYVSLLGEGLHYSINYEQRWPVGRAWMSLSGGLAYVNTPSWHLAAEDGWTASWNSYPDPKQQISGALFSLPFRWNWFSGRTHHREHGAGIVLGHAWWADPGRDGYEADIVSTALCVSIKPVGYRFQKGKGGIYASLYSLLFFKAIEFNSDWSEYLRARNDSEHPINLWIGVDLGYTFKNRK